MYLFKRMKYNIGEYPLDFVRQQLPLSLQSEDFLVKTPSKTHKMILSLSLPPNFSFYRFHSLRLPSFLENSTLLQSEWESYIYLTKATSSPEMETCCATSPTKRQVLLNLWPDTWQHHSYATSAQTCHVHQI